MTQWCRGCNCAAAVVQFATCIISRPGSKCTSVSLIRLSRRRRSVILSLTDSYGRGTGMPTGKLQALVYDILPSEVGAGKRCSCRKPVFGVWISYYTFESVATTPAESPSSGLSTVVGLVRSTPLTECRPGPDRRPLKNYWTEGAAGAEIWR